MKKANNKISEQTKNEAMQIAKSTQKPGQTKEQTKLIAQGIEKGIAQYKKQQKEKARQASKAQKKEKREKVRAQEAENKPADTPIKPEPADDKSTSMLPWMLLVVSWMIFIAYLTAK